MSYKISRAPRTIQESQHISYRQPPHKKVNISQHLWSSLLLSPTKSSNTAMTFIAKIHESIITNLVRQLPAQSLPFLTFKECPIPFALFALFPKYILQHIPGLLLILWHQSVHHLIPIHIALHAVPFLIHDRERHHLRLAVLGPDIAVNQFGTKHSLPMGSDVGARSRARVILKPAPWTPPIVLVEQQCRIRIGIVRFVGFIGNQALFRRVDRP